MESSNHTTGEQQGVSIYYHGKIFVGIDVNSDDYVLRYLPTTNHERYPLIGPHSFKDGEDVTGRYELKFEGCISYNNKDEWIPISRLIYESYKPEFRRITAIPLPTPVQEGDAERKDPARMFTAMEMHEQYKKGYKDGFDAGVEDTKLDIGKDFSRY